MLTILGDEMGVAHSRYITHADLFPPFQLSFLLSYQVKAVGQKKRKYIGVLLLIWRQ